ncbi:MAG: hypothetical protein ACE5GQ_03925, partial [Nitrospinales bacterium]
MEQSTPKKQSAPFMKVYAVPILAFFVFFLTLFNFPSASPLFSQDGFPLGPQIAFAQEEEDEFADDPEMQELMAEEGVDEDDLAGDPELEALMAEEGVDEEDDLAGDPELEALMAEESEEESAEEGGEEFADSDEFAEDDEEEEEEGEEEEEEDESWKTDVGPAQNQVVETFRFPGIGNRHAVWWAAQLHILFASFILGCPMFVVIMEVMGARRTQGVRKAVILSNVFLGVLIGVVVGITGEIIVDIHHGVLYGLWACSFAALVISFLNYFHRVMNAKVCGVLGGVVGTIFAASLVEGGGISGLILAFLNGVAGGLMSNLIMFAEADFKYERLSHEITKVIGICYSFTALTGGAFLLVMIVGYRDFISYLLSIYPILFMIVYPTLFILETIVMYIYVYSWDPLNRQNKKGRHIVCGVV